MFNSNIAINLTSTPTVVSRELDLCSVYYVCSICVRLILLIDSESMFKFVFIFCYFPDASLVMYEHFVIDRLLDLMQFCVCLYVSGPVCDVPTDMTVLGFFQNLRLSRFGCIKIIFSLIYLLPFRSRRSVSKCIFLRVNMNLSTGTTKRRYINFFMHDFFNAMIILSLSGVLGYYLAQLNDMIQYPDLRTEVFQSFREIGNAMLFCLLVEQSLVSTSSIACNSTMFCVFV
jgi:Cytoplasmic Fragile-X interacting family